MPGPLWEQVIQIGKEASYGVPVAATRRAYWGNPRLERPRAPRMRSFPVGRRDNQLAGTLGSIAASGAFAIPASADELLEYLECLFGAATITTPAGGTATRRHRYTLQSSVPSMTIERNDGANVRRGVGYRTSKLTFEGNVEGEHNVAVELFGKDYTSLAALTSSLNDATPTFIEGWETALYLDAFAGTPGTTRMSGLMYSWSLAIEAALGRKYTADNTLAMKEIVPGEIKVNGRIMIDAIMAQALTEYANWDAETARLLRFEFGQNEQIESSPTNELQTVTITGTPTGGTFTLTYRGQTTGNIAYNATAATVLAALEGLLTIGLGNVTVGGGPGPGTPYTVTFVNQLSGLDVPQMTAAHAFTGGSSPNIGVATTTPGVGYKRAIHVDVPLLWTGFNLNAEAAASRFYELDFEYLYDTTNAFGVRVDCYNNRTATFNNR